MKLIGIEPVSSRVGLSYDAALSIANVILKTIRSLDDVELVIIHSRDLIGMLVQELVLKETAIKVCSVVPYLDEQKILSETELSLYVQSLRHAKIVYADEIYLTGVSAAITQYSTDKKDFGHRYILDTSTDLVLIKGWWGRNPLYVNPKNNVLIEVDARRPQQKEIL